MPMDKDRAHEISDKLADIQRVIADVGKGDYTTRLEAELPEEHPLRALYSGINEMIEALAAQEQRNIDYHRELEDKLATIEQQRAAIRELGTPIMEVWEGILC